MQNPVFHLPPFTVGPYTLRISPAPRSAMEDRRRLCTVDWNRGALVLREDLSMEKALEVLMRVLALVVHYRSGLNDACDEEAFTHSLATGLVELAGTSPQFWFEFHALLDDYFGHGDLWAPVAGGRAEALPAQPLPKELRMGRRVCAVHWLTEQEWKDPNAYALYTPGAGIIEMRRALSGNQRALVLIHEVLHFVHDCCGLGDHHDERHFCRQQGRGLLKFLEQNPHFWAWWLHQVGAGTRRAWSANAR